MFGVEFLLPIAKLVAAAAVPIFGALIHKRLRTTEDHARAQQLSVIANAAASLVVSKNPNDAWRNLLASTVRELSNAAGVPTRNAAALEREATAALLRVGARPPGA